MSDLLQDTKQNLSVKTIYITQVNNGFTVNIRGENFSPTKEFIAKNKKEVVDFINQAWSE